MKHWHITLTQGSGVTSGQWLWYIDRNGVQVAEGSEATLDDAVSAAGDSLAFILQFRRHTTSH